MTHFSQMAGLAVQNFVSAAAGMAVLVALVRGFKRHSTETIGNFWVDLTRSTLYILMPLALIWSLLLVSQGVVQTFSEYKTISLTQSVTYDTPKLDAQGNPMKDEKGNPATEKAEMREQVIPLGPAASQIAIKELGTNGGGFYNANSSHPFESSNPFTNLFETFLLLLTAFCLPRTFGKMVGDNRQGYALVAVMVIIWLAAVGGISFFEAQGAGLAPQLTHGAMEGKNVITGTPGCSVFAASTTVTSTGAVSCFHDSLTSFGGGITLFDMALGEVAPGGVGAGLYGLLILAIVTVFVGGLMVGRTPEYIGQKIRPVEMKYAALYFLTTPVLILTAAGLSIGMKTPQASILSPGPHGLTEVMYAFTSMANNNGSAFAGLTTNTDWYNTIGGIVMLLGRFAPEIFALGLAGSLARQQPVPASAGTLETHKPLFVGMLVAVIGILVGLTYFPALALGPFAEGLH